MKTNTLLAAFLLALLTIALTACSPQANQPEPVTAIPTQTAAKVQKTYNDPFAYCAAVGTIDTPDARYTGPQISDEIINGFKIAAGLEASTEPLEMFRKTTIWRCMDGQVYACNFGANLPCDSKADTSREPARAMTTYCQSNPDAASIPMSVTGHATIYSWDCTGHQATVLAQIDHADAAGYLGRIWYQIPNSP